MNDSKPVSTGTRLGPYEIVARIGAGGMGEVFRARDTRLDRSVAVKVLPSEFATNTQLKLRFEREAKSISQLNHPHICTLHDVGSVNGVEFLVMELIEGESLADRLARGPLPLGDVLRYGAQIAAALDAAHRAGIVHRDLKPGNIMITKSGAKLLDFGLARMAAVAVVNTHSHDTPTAALHDDADAANVTAHKPLTAEGTILGTFQYMAPEQLEGLDADARTDIFALGAVLYEMLTGKRAFDGKTRTSLIAAIVGGEPRPVNQLQPFTPAALEHVIRRCLAKDPAERWQSASDVAAELRWVGESASQPAAVREPQKRQRLLERLMWLVLLLAAGAAAFMLSRRAGANDSLLVASLDPPAGTSYVASSAPALSPDGRFVASVVLLGDGVRRLHAKALDGSWSQMYADSDGAYAPFWSSDSARLGFFMSDKIKLVDREGGTPEEVSGVVAGGPDAGASLAADGSLLFINKGQVFRTRIGGAPMQVTKPRAGALYRWPEWLPDGRHFIVMTGSEPPAPSDGIAIGNIETGEVKLLVPSFSRGIVVGDYLLYARGSSTALFGRRLDVGKMSLEGAETRLRNQIGFVPGRGTLLASATPTHLVYFEAANIAADTELAVVDRGGKTVRTLGASARYYSPRVSPNGARVAMDMSDAARNNGDIWILDLHRDSRLRLTFEENDESVPVWVNNDTVIYFRSHASGYEFFERAAAGTGAERTLALKLAAGYPGDVSSDEKYLAFDSRHPTRKADVLLYDRTTHKTSELVATPFDDQHVDLHPGGRWFAYASDESGRAEVYVQSLPLGAGKWLISRNGGSAPAWSRDGSELFYESLDGKLVSVAVTTSATTFDYGAPQPLFDIRLRGDVPVRQYDVFPNGTFLLNREVTGDRKPLTIVANWQRLLPSQ